MKKHLPLFILLLNIFLSGKTDAQTLTSSNLPIVFIDTYGGTINDTLRIISGMSIIDNGFGNRNYTTDSINDYRGRIEIEIRGSTSQQYPKKAYGFETELIDGSNYNYPVLGFPAENDWILYAPYPDKTLIRNSFTFYLARSMGHYATRTRHVELLLNNSYRGVYELHEKIKKNRNRVDIADLTPADTSGELMTGGYIIKIDKVTGSGDSTWYSPYDPALFFQYHYPNDTAMTQGQRNYIKEYVTNFERVLIGPQFNDIDSGYARLIDSRSFIDFIILQELGRTVDGYRSSTFMYKDRDSLGGKLTMGPMWDFNLSFGNCDYCYAYDSIGFQFDANNYCTGRSPDVAFWFRRLTEDSLFADSLHCRWDYLRQTILHTDSVNAWIDSMALYLDESQQRNFVKWPILGTYVNWNYYIGNTFQDEIDYLKMFVAARSRWLDTQWQATNCAPIINNVHEQTNADVTVSPNPFSNNVTVRFSNYFNEKKNICVMNEMGEKVFYQESGIRSRESIINLSFLPQGIYFLTITSDKNFFVKKIEKY